MELFTLDRSFKKRRDVDVFNSLIWTERYYGDSEIELVVPLSMTNIDRLAVGTFVGLVGTDEIMILETMSIENNQIKITGISILPWLNNRFVRHSGSHIDRYWYMAGMTVGHTLWEIVRRMCTWDGSYHLNYEMGLRAVDYDRVWIDGLTLDRYDDSGPSISVGVPYGPVYDALREIATTYSMGMRIVLSDTKDQNYWTRKPPNSGPESSYSYYHLFRTYYGDDRSSNQSVFPVVRFSPQTDSLKNIKELQSAKDFKTIAYSFAPSDPGGLTATSGSGYASLLPTPGQYQTADPAWPFDCRFIAVYADDITTDLVGTSATNLKAVLNSRAADALTNNPFLIAVDGEISPEANFQYGTDYGLGDIIEVEGNSGVVQRARVTEFIRSQDASGERNYPTVQMFSS